MKVDAGASTLLRLVARLASESSAQRTQEIARGAVDWECALQLARRHRVLELLYSRLTELDVSIPHDVRELLLSEHRRNALHSIANAAELISVLRRFDGQEIPAMPFKGIVLAASIYHDMTARYAGDLDILIDRRDLLRASSLLLESGYELKTPVREDGSPADKECYEYHFERPADGMVLELRWRMDLDSSKFRRDLGMDWVWPRRQSLRLAGAEVPNIDPETTLLVLCLHGCKHAWSRLLWICDVAQLLNEFAGLDWKRVTREAKRNGLWRPLAIGALLANRVSGARLPPDRLRRFQADSTAVALARHVEENIFDRPGTTPRGRFPYSIQLLDFHDRLRFLLSGDLFRPNERDRAVVNLPKPLHAFYYLVRPFRILRDRSAR